MSTATVRQIIARAAAEPEFRGRLLTSAANALAGYDLSQTELAALSGLWAEGFDSAAANLEARISKAHATDIAELLTGVAQPTGF
jgi:hypothetical protein